MVDCTPCNETIVPTQNPFPVLQEETQEYASEAKLRELVKRYSEFINFPIYLYESKEIDVPIEEDAEEPTTSSVSDEIEDEGKAWPSGFFTHDFDHLCANSSFDAL